LRKYSITKKVFFEPTLHFLLPGFSEFILDSTWPQVVRS